ncbi:MAG TPA: hypothetical protein VKM55_01790 [Candidatus Lokiarchaeia archaeon]|nr:hypothetical protein [Candidatus Lokiarchaeia archaeon]
MVKIFKEGVETLGDLGLLLSGIAFGSVIMMLIFLSNPRQNFGFALPPTMMICILGLVFSVAGVIKNKEKGSGIIGVIFEAIGMACLLIWLSIVMTHAGYSWI